MFRMDEKLSEVVRPQNIPLFPELCACVFVCVCVCVCDANHAVLHVGVGFL